MKDAIDSIMKTRSEHLEKMSAAFLQEVGSCRASLFELVEERSVDGLRTTWYFAPKKNNK